MRLAEAVEVLERTPAVLRAMLGGLSDGWTTSHGGSWSPFDIIGHLIEGERTDWVPRIRLMLEHGDTRPFDTFDRTGMFATAAGATMSELLDRFAGARVESLAAVRTMDLGDEALERPGRHPELGAVTLGQHIATWATHDLSHIGQIAEAMARHYRDAVGPWRAYLPSLDRPDEG